MDDADPISEHPCASSSQVWAPGAGAWAVPSLPLGMTWRAALGRLRMLRSIEALAYSDAPVTAVAFEDGHSFLAVFDAAFRDPTGRTPTDYRARFRLSRPN